MRLHIVPVTLEQANDFVRQHHRHNRALPGYRFALGVADQAGRLRGVAIVGYPAARALNDGVRAEVRRVCTDGTPNACSMLYGAARRAARAMGHRPVITYTLPSEGGASLRAAGFRIECEAGRPSRDWGNRPGRTVDPIEDDLVGGKWRWTDEPAPALDAGGEPETNRRTAKIPDENPGQL